MKRIIDHPKYGRIIYEENFWTGRKTVTVNGDVLVPQSKSVFLTKEGESVSVIGNYLIGVRFTIGTDTFQAVAAIKWYEIALSVLTVVFALVWGNVPALCKIVPLVGGAVGGFLSALIAMIGLFLMKRTDKVWLKLVIWLVSFDVMFAVLLAFAALFLVLG